MSRLLSRCRSVSLGFAMLLPGATGAIADDPAFAESVVTLPGTVQFPLTSREGLTYRIFLSIPQGPAPESGFPVLYHTDGNSTFPLMLAAAQRSGTGGEMVVVGVGYPGDVRAEHLARRTLDLTTRADPAWLATQPRQNMGDETGGCDAFLDFIEQNVKPEVERRVRIDRQRQVLFGHSFGGLFALHVLFTRPEAFQAYAASSPSIWWNERSILQTEAAFVRRDPGDALPRRLVLTVGQRERAGTGETPERTPMLAYRRQVDNARELSERLTANERAGVQVSFEEFANEDHGSAVLPACMRAVRAVHALGR